MKGIVSGKVIEQKIHVIRGQKFILDADLAAIYGVTTKRLNEQVRRNRHKFPDDFVFRLNAKETGSLNWSQNATSSANEYQNLRSQNATSSSGYGGRRYLPYAFTEHGAIMAANVLNSPRAVQMSVFVVRAFIKMRSFLADRKELAEKLVELEKKLTERLDVHPAPILQPVPQSGTGRRAGFRPWGFTRSPSWISSERSWSFWIRLHRHRSRPSAPSGFM